MDIFIDEVYTITEHDIEVIAIKKDDNDMVLVSVDKFYKSNPFWINSNKLH